MKEQSSITDKKGGPGPLDKKLLYAILIIISGCLVMAFTDAVIKPVYTVKSVIKIVFFLIVPLLFFCKNKDGGIRKIIMPDKKGLVSSLLLGVGIYIIVFGAYLVSRKFYDFSPIGEMLSKNVGVTGDNFIFVSLYISFCNSFLEEFFFRGFAFLYISEYLGRKRAYLFSSVIFAVYHIAIMSGWFSPILFISAMLGLFVGGCIFNYLDEKKQNIYNSWTVHMFANFAINTVGFILFGII